VEITVRNRRILVAAVATAAIGCALGPLSAQALTSGTGTDTLTVTGGSLSVASVGSATFTVTLGVGTVTTAATNLNAGTYSDTTGSGAGFNGTLALYQFVNTQAWVPTGTALSTNNSATYTGTTNDATYSVAVTANAATTVNVTWSGTEAGSGTATKGSAFAIGTHGLTITFATGITYLVTDTYSIKADVLATSALTMAAGGSCVAQGTTATGANLPTMTNTASTVTGGTYNTYGAAVKVITAAANAGIGSFVCTPKATISADSNTTLASSYTATAQYSIVTGP
jgi:hypothetical protein